MLATFTISVEISISAKDIHEKTEMLDRANFPIQARFRARQG